MSGRYYGILTEKKSSQNQQTKIQEQTIIQPAPTPTIQPVQQPQFNTVTLKRPLVILDTAKTMIAPPYKDGANTRRYEGTISYLKVFNRTLSDEEVKENYINSTVTNTDSLELYYDFTSLGYASNDGYYPTVKDDYIMTSAEGQILTQLPDDNNRLYIKEANSGDSTVVATGTKVTDDKLENIFNVYA